MIEEKHKNRFELDTTNSERLSKVSKERAKKFDENIDEETKVVGLGIDLQLAVPLLDLDSEAFKDEIEEATKKVSEEMNKQVTELVSKVVADYLQAVPKAQMAMLKVDGFTTDMGSYAHRQSVLSKLLALV